MRLTALIVVLGLVGVILGLVGCSGEEAALTATISGSVVNQVTGAVEPNAMITLFQNGTIIQSNVAVTSEGKFVLRGVPAGDNFRLLITSPTNAFVRTIVGPFSVTGNIINQKFTVLSVAQVEEETGITPPPNNTTANLVVYARNAAGQLVQVVVQVNAFTPSAPGAPATLTGITPGTYDITISTTSAPVKSVVLRDVTLDGGTLTIIDTNVGGAGPGFTVSGNVTNQATGTLLPGVTVTLLQNGTQIGQPVTTNQAGGFSFSGVPNGTGYELRVTSPANEFVPMTFGPFSVPGNVTGLTLTVLTAAQVEELTGVAPPPDNTTANLVVFARNAAGQLVQAIAQVDLFTPSAPGAPVTLTGITPGTYNITVSSTNTPATSVVLQNVTLSGGSLTVINTKLEGGVPANFTVSGTVSNQVTGTLLPGATVTLLQNGVQVGEPQTTNEAGAFTFTNVPNGTGYTIRATGDFLTTTVGPFKVNNANVVNRNIQVLTATQMADVVGIPAPNAGLANVVVYVQDTNGVMRESVIQLDTQTPSAAGSPARLLNVNPGTFTLSVTTTGENPRTVTFPNVTLAANNTYVFRAIVTAAEL